MVEFFHPAAPSAWGRWITALALLAILLALVGREVFEYEANRAKEARYYSLASVGRIKADLITHWRRTQLETVERMARRPYFAEALGTWEERGSPEAEAAAWASRLAYERHSEVPEAMLIGPDARRVLASTAERPEITAETRAAVLGALNRGRGMMSEPFLTAAGTLRIDTAAPITGPAGRPIAVLLFRIDPEVFLHPLVRLWPAASSSAESMIVRRVGDDVVFTSPRHHDDAAPGQARIPLSMTEASAVQVVLGRTGRYDGPDYRNVPVVADLRPIADSTWHLVTKMDASEVIAPARARAVLILLVFGLLALFAAGATALIHQRRQSSLFRHLFLSERLQREEREQFRTILYSIGDGVITTDSRGRIEIMNPAAERLTGWSEHDARSRLLDEVFVALDSSTRTRTTSAAAEALRRNHAFKVRSDATLVARDGMERPIADSAAPIRDATGAARGAVLVFRDRSEERAAEQALRDSELRFRQLADALPQLVWTAEPDGRVDFYNDRHREYAGIRKTAHGFEWEPVIHPDDLEATVRAWDVARRTGKTYEIEHRIRGADGVCRWLLSRAVPVINREGAIVKWFGTATDIDALKSAERAVAESEARYRSLFENMNEGFAVGEPIRDDSGQPIDVRLDQVNAAFMRETGLGDRVVDRPFKELVPHFEPVWIETLARVAATGEPARLTEFSRDMGRYFEAFTFQPESGKFCMLLRDVTGRVVAEAALKRTLAELTRSNKDLEQFAFAASHDLKSPLRAIESLAQWLDEDLDDRLQGEPREHLRLLRQRARRMGRLLDDLLSYARAGASGRAETVDVQQLLAQVRDFLEPPPDMRLEVDPPLPVLTTPIAPLRQVFTNLIANAIKHHDREAGLIRISAREHDGFVEFSVEDDGPGIPQAFRKRAFEMFQTLRPRDEVEGSGLGLAIVRRIVESVGGTVDLGPAAGRGTLVRFSWPLRVAAPGPEANGIEAAGPNHEHTRSDRAPMEKSARRGEEAPFA